jgi:hypothetical protein
MLLRPPRPHLPAIGWGCSFLVAFEIEITYPEFDVERK